MNVKQEEWFQKEAGARIDALEAALNAFALYQIDSLIALRRQIERIASECAMLGLDALAQAARSAHDAGALDARSQTERLLVLLRSQTRACKAPGLVPRGARDPETGLMSREAFTELFQREIASRSAHAALAAVRVANLEDIRKTHGHEAARNFFGHTGRMLTQLVRDGDQVARFTDDEFVVFLPGEDARGLQIALERLESAVGGKPFQLPNGTEEAPVIAISGCPFGDVVVPAGNAAPAALRIGVLSRSPATAHAMIFMLRKEGFEVAASVDDGAARYAAFSEQRVDLVIVEEVVSEMEATLDGLRGALAGRRTPVLVVVDTPADGRRALSRGAADFLVKPLQLQDLVGMASRFARRGVKSGAQSETQTRTDMLVVSNDLYHLIAIGTALQKQAGHVVRLGRGWRDARKQVQDHRPAGVIVDLRLVRDGTRALLQDLADSAIVPQVALVVEPAERRVAEAMNAPPVRAVFRRPLDLMALPAEIKRAFVLPHTPARSDAAAILQQEIIRIMQLGDQPAD